MNISNKTVNIDTVNIYAEKQAISQEIQQVKNEIKSELNSLFSELLDETVANNERKAENAESATFDENTKSEYNEVGTIDSEESGVVNIGTVNIYLNDILEQIENEKSSAEPSTKIENATGKSINSTDFSSLPFNVPSEYQSIIDEMSSKYNVDSKVIASVIFAESSFKPNAVSSSGAQGLMQLMPDTAKYLGVTDSFDIHKNIEGGTKYLSQMLNRYDNNLSLALAAYNAGPGNVDKYKGVPPFSETQNYVKKINSFLV